ncbi:MAG: O-antigen translocase [Verrucomicrobiales bacterium]|nr:O-antigen translocase [Verrucomicrobiales bacterium]
MNPKSLPKDSSYAQILRSTTIIGGSQGANYLIGLIRTKLVALLIGPSGIGMVGLFHGATTLIRTIAQLGIDQSGVRDIAKADASDDVHQLAETTQTLRRLCWLTGIGGWLLTAVLSYPLSIWTFGDSRHAVSFMFIGSTLLFGAISGGQVALIRGKRRIGDIARISVISSLLSTIAAVGIYLWLREDGIVPVLVATAAIYTLVSWLYARKIRIEKVPLTWMQVFSNAGSLVHLGLAFTFSPLVNSGIDLFVRTLIINQFGLHEGGIFQGAWAVSGIFMGYILNAMMTDFYPRLTTVADDNQKVNQYVNEQTEIAAMMALPGLVALIGFAPIVMHLLYSREFVSGGMLLIWFSLGGAFQAICWPMGVIQRAKGSARWMVISQCIAAVVRVGLILALLKPLGIAGIALAYPLSSLIHCLTTFAIARHLSQFFWTREAFVISSTLLVFAAASAATHLIESISLQAIGASTLLILGTAVSFRGIVNRLAPEHRLIRAILRFPGGQRLIQLARPNAPR